MYFTCFDNDFVNGKVTIDVKSFDFSEENPKAKIKYTRTEDMEESKYYPG